MKKSIKKILNQLPYIKGLYSYNKNFKSNSAYPAGHFYSPIVSVADIKRRADKIWENRSKEGINGIDLNLDEQLNLLDLFLAYYSEIPFQETKQIRLRYYFENDFYSYTDAVVLYGVIRLFKPKRVIEIGSGFSSSLMLDINQFFFNNSISLTFIDPYIDRLLSLMTEEDKVHTTVIQQDVQLISLDTFKQLEAGDILFVDSTHVSKTGSDVNYILFEILPILNSGVLIHFHDVFYPFEYPKEWVFNGRNWNENYILKAFMMYNKSFKIKLFSDYIHLFHKEAFKNMPLCYKNTGGNLWLEKV